MSLSTPKTVEMLQAALSGKAKREPDFRFYSLYDKMCREDVLAFAYRRCKANSGSPGVDGETFEGIEAYGAERWLGGLVEDLRAKRYKPGAVRRVNIPKGNGKVRPLGIPTIRDRVAQTAAVIVLEPIFEADFQPEQHAYRPGHNAHDAIRQVRCWLNRGHDEIVDADLSGYFDSIPHHEVMKSVSRRVSDGAMLRLVKSWLEMPVEEANGHGRVKRTTINRDTKRGTPQGAPISPLLSNIYMRRFLLGWKTLGYQHRLNARIVNYADDFVILCKGTASKAICAMQEMVGKLKLVVNEQKTRICQASEGTFDFLGYTIGTLRNRKTGKPYIGVCPSRKSVSEVLCAVTEQTSRKWGWVDEREMVKRLNWMLTGWANYFSLGGWNRVCRRIDQHVQHRLRRWMCIKHKVGSGGYRKWSALYFYDNGLVRLKDWICSPS